MRGVEASAFKSSIEKSIWNVRRHVPLGVEHILSGWDHVIFLLALLLMATSLRSALVVVTGFTVGHSVTLALATLGFASPDIATVEALIGLSIVLVAVENIWLAEGRGSPVVPRARVAALCALAEARPRGCSRPGSLGFGGGRLRRGLRLRESRLLSPYPISRPPRILDTTRAGS